MEAIRTGASGGGTGAREKKGGAGNNWPEFYRGRRQEEDRGEDRERDKRSRVQRQKEEKGATERDSERCQQLLKVIARQTLALLLFLPRAPDLQPVGCHGGVGCP